MDAMLQLKTESGEGVLREMSGRGNSAAQATIWGVLPYSRFPTAALATEQEQADAPKMSTQMRAAARQQQPNACCNQNQYVLACMLSGVKSIWGNVSPAQNDAQALQQPA